MDTLNIVCPHCDATNRIPAARLTDGGKCGRCKQPLFTAQPLTLSAANFTQHLNASDLPLLVDFWAPWCGPCRTMAPTFERAAQQLEPHIRLAKVNTEAEQHLAATFNIRSIPTLILFKQGREIARHSGTMELSGLAQWTRAHL